MGVASRPVSPTPCPIAVTKRKGDWRLIKGLALRELGPNADAVSSAHLQRILCAGQLAGSADAVTKLPGIAEQTQAQAVALVGDLGTGVGVLQLGDVDVLRSDARGLVGGFGRVHGR